MPNAVDRFILQRMLVNRLQKEAQIGEFFAEHPELLAGAGIGGLGGLLSTFLLPRYTIQDLLYRTLLGAGVGSIGGYTLRQLYNLLESDRRGGSRKSMEEQARLEQKRKQRPQYAIYELRQRVKELDELLKSRSGRAALALQYVENVIEHSKLSRAEKNKLKSLYAQNPAAFVERFAKRLASGRLTYRADPAAGIPSAEEIAKLLGFSNSYAAVPRLLEAYIAYESGQTPGVAKALESPKVPEKERVKLAKRLVQDWLSALTSAVEAKWKGELLGSAVANIYQPALLQQYPGHIGEVAALASGVGSGAKALRAGKQLPRLFGPTARGLGALGASEIGVRGSVGLFEMPQAPGVPRGLLGTVFQAIGYPVAKALGLRSREASGVPGIFRRPSSLAGETLGTARPDLSPQQRLLGQKLKLLPSPATTTRNLPNYLLHSAIRKVRKIF